MSAYFSLSRYSVLDSPQLTGMENYERLVSDATFRRSIVVTAVYTLIAVPLQTILSLAIASAVARTFKGRFGRIIRSTLFIPVMSSMVLVGAVWRVFLGGDDGLVNQLLALVGVSPVSWLGRPWLALLMVALVTVWKNVGYFLVIYYAGIMEIPGDLYEAAALDGASASQQFRHITVPSLRPVTLLVVILGTIWSFQVFDLVYSLTGGGPGGATSTLVMAIYQAGFKNYQFGYASAMAMVLFLIILVVSIIQRRVLGKED
ncbi:sugar ABC transporter permease [Actinomyces sp. 186855]|nr:sugar ABC transporter permease [Actinomyces sp. AC-20-1]MCL3789970.1 sugar ABC transporter permease [Actinomyces sp. 187325]MCL3792311.1 sugar ABC transporter permease [Actinomyces sp. 186855]MCL3794511.1 sugar ABC transporter permease [Actinomyces sp. 217892]